MAGAASPDEDRRRMGSHRRRRDLDVRPPRGWSAVVLGRQRPRRARRRHRRPAPGAGAHCRRRARRDHRRSASTRASSAGHADIWCWGSTARASSVTTYPARARRRWSTASPRSRYRRGSTPAPSPPPAGVDSRAGDARLERTARARNDTSSHDDISTVFNTIQFAQVSAGLGFTCAVRRGGSTAKLWCWGDNTFGQSATARQRRCLG